MAKKYLSLEEAAAQVGVSVDALKELRENGEIRGFADRGTWKFRSEDVEELVRRRVPDSDPEIPLYDEPVVSPKVSFVDQRGTAKAKPAPEQVDLDQEEAEVAEQPTMITRGRGGKSAESSLNLNADDEMLSEFALKKDSGSDSDVALSGPGSSPKLAGDVLSKSDSDVKVVEETSTTSKSKKSGSTKKPSLASELLGEEDDSDVALSQEDSGSSKPRQSTGLLQRPGDKPKKGPSIADDLLKSDSDVKTLGIKPGSDSDVALSLGDSGAAKSGLKTKPGSDSDVTLSLGDSDLAKKKKKGSDSNIVLSGDKTDPEIQLADVDSGISLSSGDDSGLTLGDVDSGLTLGMADSGISLEATDSGLTLGEAADSGISLGDADSGLTLGASDSGLTLGEADSGLTLDAKSSKKAGKKPTPKDSSLRPKKKKGSDSEISVNLQDPSTDSDIKLLPAIGGSGVRRGSGVASILDDDEDDSGLILPSDSGVQLAGKSGIRMMSPSDSGILLERPGDSGINLTDFGGDLRLGSDVGSKPGSGKGSRAGSGLGKPALSGLSNRLSGIGDKTSGIGRKGMSIDDLEHTAPMLLLPEDDDDKPLLARTEAAIPSMMDEDEFDLEPPEASDSEMDGTNVILFDDDEELEQDEATVIKKGEKKVKEAFDLDDEEKPEFDDEDDEVEVADDEMEDREVGDLDVFQEEDEEDLDEEFVAGTSQIGLPVFVPPVQPEWSGMVFALVSCSTVVMLVGLLVSADLLRIVWAADERRVFDGGLIGLFAGLFK